MILRNRTRNASIALAALTLTGLSLAPVFAQDSPELPPGHPQMPQMPQMPQLPPGHPELTPKAPPSGDPAMPPGHPSVPRQPEADPADVASVDAILKSFYESISGPAGEQREWDRFRSLFMPGVKLITVRRTDDGQVMPVTLSTEDYVSLNDHYFSNGGYYEEEIHRASEQYGSIANVFSTYASRRTLEEAEPYSRGINSMQLLYDGTRWWIVSFIWDYERSDEEPLPEKYLAGGPGAGAQ